MKAKLLMLFIGMTIGSVITALYLGEKHAQEMEEEEIEYTRDEGPLRRYNQPPEITSHATEPGDKILIMNKDRYKKVATNYNTRSDIGSEVSPIKVNNEPYLISIDEFSEDDSGNEKITVFYYKKDAVLTDEDEEVIEDVEEVLGKEAIECFNIPGYEVIYVRNNRIEIDYEVVIQDKSYFDMLDSKFVKE